MSEIIATREVNRNGFNSFLIVAALVILSVAFLVIAGSTVESTTIQFDEFTDLAIASALSENPLRGSTYDGSQARFPMYATAAAIRLVRIVNPDFELLEILSISRWMSILMTVLAIWGTYILGARLFNVATGMIAAVMFTISPYVLHFGRDALTQGDAFTTAPVVFTLVAFERFNSRRTTFWLVCFSFCLALAIAAKFYLVILLPALITYHVIVHFSERYRDPYPQAASAKMEGVRSSDRRFSYLVMGTGLLALIALVVSLQWSGQPPALGNRLNHPAIVPWLLTLIGILLVVVIALKDAGIWRSYPKDRTVFWRLGWSWLAIIPLTGAIVLAFFPVHIFNPLVIPILVGRAATMDGNSALLATSMDSTKLYIGLILFKNGLPLGILAFVALVWAVKESFKNKGALLIILVLAFFGLMLVVLPLQQPFWLLSVYPLIMVVLSAMIVQSLISLRGNRLRPIWIAILVAASVWLIIGLVRVYPTFGYYGYELVGEQWMGSNSRGYREVVVVTNDGSTEAISWLRQNVPDESRVISYLNDIHLINYLNRIDPFDFEFVHALQYANRNELDDDLASADYVVVRTVDDTGLPPPVSDPDFVKRFGAEPVYQVVRGRGVYKMPVFQVFERVSSTNDIAVQE